MGAWGSGHFENDSALDWLAGFNAKRSLARLKVPMAKGLKDKECDSWDDALVAAEIVSLLRSHPAKDCPEDLQIWAQQDQTQPDTSLIALARKFVAHVAKQTDTKEYRDIFRNPKDADAYLADKKKLLKRLKSNYKKLPKISGQAVENKPRKEPWVFIGYVKIQKEYGGSSESRDGRRRSLSELPEVIDLLPHSGAHISLELHLDFFFTSQEIERITRLIQQNGRHRVKLVRLSGGTYLKNKDLMLFLENIAPHVEYLDTVMGGVELTPLMKAGRLLKLSLYFNNKIKGSDLTYLSGMPELEILRIIRLPRLPSGDIFSGNPKLKYLIINTKELENNRLPKLPSSLEELSLHVGKTNRETDLSSLIHLPHLKRLSLSAQHFKSLPAEGFAHLECCQIYSSMEDLKFLKSAKKLCDLQLPPLIRELTFLKGLAKLKRLKIGGDFKHDLGVTDLSPLETLPSLRTLHLHHSTQINSLPRLCKVERFEFFRMPHLKLEEVSKLPALRKLSLLVHDWTEQKLQQLKAIAPNARPAEDSLEWTESEPSRYNTYFM